MHQNFFPFLLSILLLLIVMIAYSVSVEVIEDGTPEKEDLAKALALSNRFFWRTMMEEWDCNKVEIKPNAIGLTDKDELRQICESWKVKALAANACFTSGTHEGASSSAISPNIRAANQIKEKEKPLFRVEQGELQLSSAMEAIKAAYRVLFGWREAKGFNTKFDFENESRFLNAPMTLPKGRLNQLNFEEHALKNHKINYLNEYKTNGKSVGDKIDSLIATKDILRKSLIATKKEISIKINKLLDTNKFFLKYWGNVQELGLDMEMICKQVTMIKTEYSKTQKVLKSGLGWLYDKRIFESITKKMNEERYVANVFFQYIYLVRDPMVKTYPDQLKALEPVQDPCEEAKLKVKKKNRSLSSSSSSWCMDNSAMPSIRQRKSHHHRDDQ